MKTPWKIVEHSWSETGIYDNENKRVAVVEIDSNVTEDTQDMFERIMLKKAQHIVDSVNKNIN